MRRLKTISDEKGFQILNLEDVLTLLAHKREEAFEGERAVRLFQFRIWILFPGRDEAIAAKWAELITAAKLLDRAEEDYFSDEEDARQRRADDRVFVDLTDKPMQTLTRIETLRKDNNTYRQIYDQLIGRRGGLLALIYTARPFDFDSAVHLRFDRLNIISDLIDYRLRYVQHCICNARVIADPNGANHNHALFFCWWPTHGIQSRRGKTPPNKSVVPKTMNKWWKKLERSALFVYLIQKHGFHLLPIDTDDDSFIDHLLRETRDTAEVRRFLGAYAYLAEIFTKAHGDLFYVSIPDSIPRIPISTPPFSKAELETISQYDENYLVMTQ
jgi:hypothetical protein